MPAALVAVLPVSVTVMEKAEDALELTLFAAPAGAACADTVMLREGGLSCGKYAYPSHYQVQEGAGGTSWNCAPLNEAGVGTGDHRLPRIGNGIGPIAPGCVGTRRVSRTGLEHDTLAADPCQAAPTRDGARIVNRGFEPAGAGRGCVQAQHFSDVAGGYEEPVSRSGQPRDVGQFGWPTRSRRSWS